MDRLRRGFLIWIKSGGIAWLAYRSRMHHHRNAPPAGLRMGRKPGGCVPIGNNVNVAGAVGAAAGGAHLGSGFAAVA
jgi:hypothetical protein